MAPTKADFKSALIQTRNEIGFKLVRAEVAQSGVRSHLVVEAIDVVDYSSGCVFVALIGLSVDLFGFVAFEETFHWSVVVAVAFAAHALQAVTLEQPLTILQTGVLRTTIAVEHQARFRMSKDESLIERVECQLGVNGATSSPSNDLPGEEILNGAEVSEAFSGVNISEVCEPDEVGPFGVESLVQTIGSDGRIVFRISRGNAKLGLGTSSNSSHSHKLGDGVDRA